MNTIAETIAFITQNLEPTSDTARLDAELLIGYCCNATRAYIYAHPEHEISEDHYAQLLDYLQRRREGEPMAYLLGEQEFWSMPLKITPDTLIPRPETEHLVEWVLEQWNPVTENLKIADLGTGSGAIALALAKERPDWTVHATDINANALVTASQNARAHQLHNIAFYLGDWCSALPEPRYPLIISNPPYIAEDDPHSTALRFEPERALYAGADGLSDLERIILQAKDSLEPGGYLVLEHSHLQAERVAEFFIQNDYADVVSHRDLSRQWRFTTARKAQND